MCVVLFCLIFVCNKLLSDLCVCFFTHGDNGTATGQDEKSRSQERQERERERGREPDEGWFMAVSVATWTCVIAWKFSNIKIYVGPWVDLRNVCTFVCVSLSRGLKEERLGTMFCLSSERIITCLYARSCRRIFKRNVYKSIKKFNWILCLTW